MTKTLRAGIVILVVYVAVATATIAVSGRHVRPLFEGIGPAAPYQWVKPPPLFAPSNVAPKPITTDISFAEMDKATQFGTSDGQFLLNVPAHAIPARPGEQSVRFVLDPADPATLGPLPTGLRPAGNAYRVMFNFQPGGTDASPLVAPGNVTLTVPEPVKTIIFSSDGRVWQTLPSQLLANVTTVGTTFRAAGWYLGAADAATAPPGQLSGKPSTTKRFSTLVVIGLVVALTVALVGIPALIRRRKPRSARPRGRADTKRPRPSRPKNR